MSLTGFRGVDIPVARGELVRGRQDRLLEENFPDAHIEPVPLRRFSSLCLPCLLLVRSLDIPVKEGLGADILQSMLKNLGVIEERIERIDMRTDCSGQGRIGRVVLWWVPEELLPAEYVVIDRPLCVCRCRSHGEACREWSEEEEKSGFLVGEIFRSYHHVVIALKPQAVKLSGAFVPEVDVLVLLISSQRLSSCDDKQRFAKTNAKTH